MSLHFKFHVNNEMKAEHSALLPLGVLGASLLKDNRTGNKGELEHIERLTTFNCVNSLTFQHYSFSITVRKFQRFAENSQFHHFSSSIWVLNIPIFKPVKHHKIVYFCVCVYVRVLCCSNCLYTHWETFPSTTSKPVPMCPVRACDCLCDWLLVHVLIGLRVHKWGRHLRNQQKNYGNFIVSLFQTCQHMLTWKLEVPVFQPWLFPYYSWFQQHL